MQFCRNLGRCEILHYCRERMHALEVHGSIRYQEHCDIAMKIEHCLQVSSLLMEIHQPFNTLLSYQLNFLLPLLSHFCLLLFCSVCDLCSDYLSSQHLVSIVSYYIFPHIQPCRIREQGGVRSRVAKPKDQEVFYMSIFCLLLSMLLLFLDISRT